MSKYLILITIAILIYVVLTIAVYYTQYRKGKSHELLNGIERIAGALVLVSIGNWLLALFFDGEDSALGWWLLTFAVGAALTSCLNILTLRTCEHIWPKSQEMEVESMKMSKKMRMAIDCLTALTCLALTIFFCYGTISHIGAISTSDMVLAVLGIILFAVGTVDFGRKFIKEIRNR
ncbi:MAG: hypothetical protein MJY72_05305 [Bacteroidales bacterium]|nr:hypothetical protein [Bacteroidales bacterium]